MAQMNPNARGQWVRVAKPSPASQGGDLLQIPQTGNPQLDQYLRQLAEHASATRQELQRVTQQHAEAIAATQAQAPQAMQQELSTQGSAPLNIHGLLGTPAVLQHRVGSNSGVALNLTGNTFAAGDKGPATGAVYNWIPLPDGTFIPKFK